jgi:uncharacterized RDD family membrane protein YckC
VSYEGGPVPPGARGGALPPPPAAGPDARLPSHLRRLVALLVDGVVLVALAVLLVSLAVLGADTESLLGRVALALGAYVVAAALYAPVCMAVLGGRTLGKVLVGLKVVREDGSRCSFGRALAREVLVKGLALGIASAITGGLALLADAVWPFVDDRRRALHDLAAGTRVVKG